MNSLKAIPFTDIVEESIEALSFAKAADLGFDAAEVRAAIDREINTGRCQLIGQSDTHIIVAWDENAPLIITINDFDKYASDVVAATPLKTGGRHG